MSFNSKMIDPSLTNEQATRTDVLYKQLVRKNRKQLSNAAVRSGGDMTYVGQYLDSFAAIAFRLAGHNAA